MAPASISPNLNMPHRLTSAPRRRVLLSLVSLTMLPLIGCATRESQTGKLTPAQIALLRSEGFTLTENGWELGLSEKVLFGFDEYTISPEHQAPLLRLGRLLADAGISDLQVNGHTDDAGSEEYNQKLSVRRATAVARVLDSVGYSQDRTHVRGYGKTMPIADNRTASGRAENRRVAIVVSVD